MRLWLAFVCFFRILFGRPLPPEVTGPAPALALPSPSAPPAKPAVEDGARAEEAGARAVLAVLQQEGRLLDFLMESIDAYDDAQVGAAVRAIHQGCRKAIAAHLPLEPVLAGKEDERVTVPSGFDPASIRLTGNVVGSPPFHGTLRHHGWALKARELKLPRAPQGAVVAAAEVEL